MVNGLLKITEISVTSQNQIIHWPMKKLMTSLPINAVNEQNFRQVTNDCITEYS